MNKTDNSSAASPRFDLNLFRVFDAVYREQNLTRAAEHLCVSQSAVSHALGRMRSHLDDPLFVREAQGVVPTPLAKRIWPQVQEGLQFLSAAVRQNETFDAARDVRQVRIAMHDELEPTLLPRFMRALHQQIPGLPIDSVRIDRPSLQTDLATGRLDCAIDAAQTADSGLASSLLLEDGWVVVSRTAAKIDADAYLHASHITVSSRPSGKTIEDMKFSRLGVHRHVAARCQHYESACQLVAESDWLLTMSRGLAESLNAHLENHIQPVPIEIPSVKVQLFWHPERDQDPAIQWLRHALTNA